MLFIILFIGNGVCTCMRIYMHIFDKIEAVLTGKYIALVYSTGGLY